MTYLGVDIGGTRIKAGLVDGDGRILARKITDTPTSLDAFKTAFITVIQDLATGEELPVGAGVGCKGIVNPTTTEVEILPGSFKFLEGVRLSSLVELALGRPLPVFADNDARVALSGEIAWGAAHGKKNVVMLTLGTGVGGAVLAEGRILRGVRGVAGHLGHISVDPEGVVCFCGNRGCIETIFSARAIEAEAIHHVHRGCESTLTDWFKGRTEELTCQTVFDIAAQGDEVALRIRDRATEKLGAMIASLLNTFDPELVILGGQISEAGGMLFEPLRRAVSSRTRRLLGREVPIVPPGVADRSGIVGAASLVSAHQGFPPRPVRS
ncbi:MAG: ROK family protein [Acidobacteriota bacterium]|nr:ROK family protein [Acidobacteriota bacterium]